MTLAQIEALPVRDLAAPNCALFLWASWPQLEDALQVIQAWGFRYKTCAFDWMKRTENGSPAIGMGYWTRANTEPCLLATRGNPKRIDAGIPMGVLEPRRSHSRKPDIIRKRIERLISGPYIELFARQRYVNWWAWGGRSELTGWSHENGIDSNAASHGGDA
jgi:site-specific DNA-methyltransferase (adenine-specific)